MSVECVLARVTVKPKNSVIKSNKCHNLFYNISSGKVEEGISYKNNCSWFEEIDDKNTILNEDTMFIDFLYDVSNVKDGYCGTCEILNEDYSYAEFRHDYDEVWKIVKDDFKDFLEKRKDVYKSMTYLMDINVHSTYDSYAGDGDVYLNIVGVTKINGNKPEKTEIKSFEYPGYY